MIGIYTLLPLPIKMLLC